MPSNPALMPLHLIRLANSVKRKPGSPNDCVVEFWNSRHILPRHLCHHLDGYTIVTSCLAGYAAKKQPTWGAQPLAICLPFQRFSILFCLNGGVTVLLCGSIVIFHNVLAIAYGSPWACAGHPWCARRRLSSRRFGFS